MNTETKHVTASASVSEDGRSLGSPRIVRYTTYLAGVESVRNYPF